MTLGTPIAEIKKEPPALSKNTFSKAPNSTNSKDN